MAASAQASALPFESDLPAFAFERFPGVAARKPVPRVYRRRQPEKTVLHKVVRENLESLLDEARQRNDLGAGYPRFVEREFRRFIRCGILGAGFARVRCRACGLEHLVAFSCRSRICPSCLSRRASDTAANLVDRILPEVPYRQWVLTFPWEIRFLAGTDADFLSRLLDAFLKTLFAWQRLRGRQAGVRDGQTGAVTFVQRFAGNLRLNPHLHMVVPDGLFVPGPEGSPAAFHPLPPPTRDELRKLVVKVASRLGPLAERRLEQARTEADSRFADDEDHALRAASAEAVRSPNPTPGQDGLFDDGLSKPLCDAADGFTLHAARTVPAHDREGLEQLCRYGLRPPFSNDRLSLDPDGRVRLRLLHPWPGGQTDVVLDPLQFLRRTAALIPRPYRNLTRYHGVLANRSKLRPFLPRPRTAAQATQPEDPAPPSPAPAPTLERQPWAVLLKRVLDVEGLKCPKCQAPMVVLAFLTDTRVVRKILDHLRIPADLPVLAPARCPFDEPVLFRAPDPDPPFILDDDQTWTARGPP